MIYSSLGLNVGMATGPVIGGILTQFWGWRSTFWYMVVLSGILLIIIVFWLPETCRTIVGDGSIPPPQRWNRNISELLRPTHSGPINHDTLATFKRRPGMLNTLKILRDRHIALLATCSALYACGITIVFATLPVVMERKYGFNPLQVGLCYIPFAVGGLTARWTAGSLVDWNFKRHAHRVGLETEKNHQSPLRKIPLEKARLQLLLPFLYFSSIIMVAYGWIMKYPIHLSAPMILLFFLGNTTAGVTSILATLMIDLHVNQPGSVLAALNAFKNLSGAAAAAAAVPMVDHLGFGWSGVIVAGLWILVSPGLWLVYFRGHAWRQARSE
jgi:predicted MFS family arabinose efflux permease